MKRLLFLAVLSGLLVGLLSSLSLAQADSRKKRRPLSDLDTALHEASRVLGTQEVQQILDRGADIESQDKYGYTALIEASETGNSAAVKLLLEKGANFEAKSDSGTTALLRAACNGRVDAVRLLLVKGANPEARDNSGVTALLDATQNHGGIEIVAMLLDKGANIEAKDDVFGRTALIRAASRGKADVVNLLVERGAKIEATDKNGVTALMEANAKGKFDVVKLLVEKEGAVKDSRAEIAPYIAELRKTPWDDEKRKLVVQYAASLPTPPAIPEEARRFFLQSSALAKQASTPSELAEPIALLWKAIDIAPWWGNAYYNLSRLHEMAGEYDDATKKLNLYLLSKPPEPDATEARTRIDIIQAEKQSAAAKRDQREAILALRYVSGGTTRVRYTEALEWWKPDLSGGIEDLYAYWVHDEDPFYVNLFRMPNSRILSMTLLAQAANGSYTGDRLWVIDVTEKGCTVGREFAFGEQSQLSACGHRYDVEVSNLPNATITVKQGSASVTIPVALLYRGRAVKASQHGDIYQGGPSVMVLKFDPKVANAAKDPSVNAMGLTPISVTPYAREQ